MAIHNSLTELFTNIANAIRAKKNSTQPIVADIFPTEIANLRTGFDYNNHEVISIPDYAFYGCEDLKSVDCGNLTSIGTSAFENCKNLESAILWDNVESVGENAFKGCPSDLIICCMFENQPESWVNNWNPDNLEVKWLGGVLETRDISDTSEDDVTAKLYNYVEPGKYMLNIVGSGNMKNYGEHSLPWNDISDGVISVEIYSDVASIGVRAFQDCPSLASITIPDSVTSIGRSAFAGCSSLTSITIPDSVTSIGDYAFHSCSSLTSITIPDGITRIGENAFGYCSSLTSITIPDSVTSIGLHAFIDCPSLASITIPDSVTSIGEGAFSYCSSLTYITIPDGVTSISEFAFSYCSSLTYITIPDGVTRIYRNAFFGCSSLISITIPDSVTNINAYAFFGCSSLTSITYTGTVSKWNSITFELECFHGVPAKEVICSDGTAPL